LCVRIASTIHPTFHTPSTIHRKTVNWQVPLMTLWPSFAWEIMPKFSPLYQTLLPPLFDGKLVGLINGLATRTEQLEIRLEAMSAGHSPQVSLAIIQGRGAVGQ